MRISRDLRMLILLLLPLVVVTVYVANAPGQNQNKPRAEYTSYDVGKTGTEALYLIFKHLGFRVARNDRRFDRISNRRGAMLLIEPDSKEPVSAMEAKAIGKWVEKGNLLFVLGVGSKKALSEFGVKSYLADIPADAVPNKSLCANGVRKIEVKSNYRLKSKQGRALIGDSSGAIAVEIERGKGKAVFFTDPDITSNSSIGHQDNAVFLVNMVSANVKGGEIVLFDEYHHGYQRLSMGRHVILALVQLSLVAVLSIYSIGRRFGAIQPLRESDKLRSGWEYVESMASLYKRANARHAALDSIYQDFRRELTRRFALSQSAEPREMAEAIMPGAPEGLEHLLLRCTQIKDISDDDLLHISEEIEDYRRILGFARTGAD